MTIDYDGVGQESDISQACAAFGLDTLNYREFPNAGPLPKLVAWPAPASAPLVQPAPAPLVQPAPAQPMQPAPAATHSSPAPYFPLLAQAIPTAAAKAAPTLAFAMARSALHTPAPVEQEKPATPPGINPAAFGAAFGAAYTAAFGYGQPQSPAAFAPPAHRA